jgi:HEAT repeat protein
MDVEIVSPEQYATLPVAKLIRLAAFGFIGMDHRWLKAMLDRPGETVAAATSYFEEPDPDAPINMTSELASIVRHLNSPDAVRFWIAFIREFPEEIPLEIIMAFRQIGAPAVEPLLAFYDERKDDPDSEAAFLLASLGVKDDRIYQRLLHHLEIEPLEASHSLATYGDSAAIPAIEQVRESAQEEWMRESMTSDIERLRNPVEETADEDDEDHDIRHEFPELAGPEFEAIKDEDIPKFLDHPDEEARGSAVRAVGAHRMSHAGVKKIFEMAKSDPVDSIRAVCWEELGAAAEDDKRIRDAMTAVLESATAPLEERSGALVGLSLTTAGDKLTRRIREFYELPETRSRAMQAMIYTRDEQFVPLFPQHLNDTDPLVQNLAMQGIGFFEIAKDAHLLEPFFDDPDKRLEALQCYALATPAPLTRSGMVDLYRKIERLAHSLDEEEKMALREAINLRLERNERPPLFNDDGEMLPAETASSIKVGRNDPCPCGSGKKYKKCCGA